MKSNTPKLADLVPTRIRLIQIATYAIACGILIGNLVTAGQCAADENSIREYLAQVKTTSYLQEGEFRIERIEPRQHVPVGAMVFQKFIHNIPIARRTCCRVRRIRRFRFGGI